MLKGLLNGSGRSEELLQFLPRVQQEAIQALPPLKEFNPMTLLSVEEWSKPIHFSWFSHTIKDYPPAAQALFLGVLPPPQMKGVQVMLSLQSPPKPITPFLRPFILDLLRKNMQEGDLVSEQYLPHSSLNCLLQIERKHLIETADFLGLYDLAADLRQVVDKELLGKIYRALKPQQLHFLHYCSKQPIKWVSAKLGLQAWDGSKAQLNHLLHYRGLIRLAKAICQEDSSFKWHLLHHLDTGRAKIIQKELYQKQDPALVTYFKNQVLHIAKRYLP